MKIEADFKSSYGAFVKADGKDLMRLLSNLINNSVEAFADKTGEVTVAVRAYRETIHLSVRDNGRGIPPEVLKRLGEAGVTHGKEGTESGSGLGVYHAKKSVEAIGGKFNIASQVGMGTQMDILLPRTETPVWFPESIKLKSGTVVCCLDDDLTIHQIWKGRLDSMQAFGKNIQIQNFTSATEFKQFVSLQASSDAEKVFLIDYELLGQGTNGLEVIQELGLQELGRQELGPRANVILVTSRYEEPEIRRKVESLKIKLLPKSLAGFVPIIIEALKTKYNWVLIDDDDLTHQTWQMAAKDNTKSFIGFKSYEEFLAAQSGIALTSVIYIDSSLGDDIKGEDVAKKIFADGFETLYLATGYSPDDFPPMSYIKAVVGKSPPIG